MTGLVDGLAGGSSGSQQVGKIGFREGSDSKALQRDAGVPTSFAAHLLPGSGRKDEGLAKVPVETSIGGTLLTVREVAARLRLSRASVYAFCERGELPHMRVGNAIRIAHGDLAVFIKERLAGRPATRQVESE